MATKRLNKLHERDAYYEDRHLFEGKLFRIDTKGYSFAFLEDARRAKAEKDYDNGFVFLPHPDLFCSEQVQSQNAAIKRHLERGEKITHREAQDLYRCDRLSARIYNLRHDPRYGYMHIKTNMVQRGKKRFAEYYLDKTSINN